MPKEIYSWPCDANPGRQLRITVDEGGNVTLAIAEDGLTIVGSHSAEAEVQILKGGNDDHLRAALMGAASIKAGLSR